MANLAPLLTPKLFGVDGKVVFVTGGGSGLGRMIAHGFAANGAKVYITGRRLPALEETVKLFDEAKGQAPSAGSITPIQGSVSSKEDITALVDQFKQHEKHLDVLVNCAGVMRDLPVAAKKGDPLEQIEESLWSASWDDFTVQLDTNLTSLYFVTIAFLPLLKQSESDPSVVNIASIAAWNLSPSYSSTSYGASKAGALQITKVLASRLSPFGIRVNSICPGIFPSEMTSPSTEAVSTGPLAKTIATNPIPRAGTEPEIVGPLLFLSSSAGGYCTGAVVVVDGGRKMTTSAMV